MARHDAPAVLHFEFYGVTTKDMAKFHLWNGLLKLFFIAAVALAAYPKIIPMIFFGIVSALWVYFIFDIALNMNRPGKGWDYLGSNDKDGRMWMKWFGKNGGEIKAVILIGIIAAINFIYLQFFL